MDYSTGTELWKYQWDFTHNPQGGWFVFEDESEGGALTNYKYLIKIEDYVIEIFSKDEMVNIVKEAVAVNGPINIIEKDVYYLSEEEIEFKLIAGLDSKNGILKNIDKIKWKDINGNPINAIEADGSIKVIANGSVVSFVAYFSASYTDYSSNQTHNAEIPVQINLRKGIPQIYYKAGDGIISFGENVNIFGRRNVELLTTIQESGRKDLEKITNNPSMELSNTFINKIIYNNVEIEKDWQNLVLNNNGVNILKIIPSLGNEFICEIIYGESKTVSIRRDDNNNDGSYSIENYNDYRLYDNGTANNNSNYELVPEIPNYTQPRVLYTSLSPSTLEFRVIAEYPVQPGIHEYKFELTDQTIISKTFVSYIETQMFDKIYLDKNQLTEDYVTIKDCNGIIKGKVQIFKATVPNSDVKVQPVIIKYKTQKGNIIDINSINETFYQAEIKITFEAPLEIEITDNDINGINFGQYSNANVISFLNSNNIGSDIKKFMVIFGKLYDNVIVKNPTIASSNKIILSVPFSAGYFGGYARTSGSNQFSLVFNPQNQLYTTSHELLHIFGLKDLMVELGYCSPDQLYLNTCNTQNKFSNIMSYKFNNCGIWIWQIKLINKN
jgi:hypothetical protein